MVIKMDEEEKDALAFRMLDQYKKKVEQERKKRFSVRINSSEDEENMH